MIGKMYTSLILVIILFCEVAMADLYKTNFKAQTPGEEPLGSIFDLLTPEEKAQYAKSFQPTQTEQAVSGFKGLADVIGGAFNNRNPTYQKDYDSKIKGRMDQDMQFVGNELTRKYAERQAKAAAEKANKEGSAFKSILDDKYPEIGTPDLTSENAWDYYKLQHDLQGKKELQREKPRPQGAQPKSPFWDTVDKKFGEDYQDYFARGGYAYAKKNLDQLKDVANSFGQGKNISGTIGMAPKWSRDLLTPEGSAVQDRIEQTVLTTLRQVLGAQFTEKEGRSILEKTFNPRQLEAENKDRLIRLTNQLEKQAMIKENAAKHARQWGTLEGYDGPMMATTADELLGGAGVSPIQQNTQAQTKQGKDGKTYTKKEDGKWYPVD
jgi:hypothetical protein